MNRAAARGSTPAFLAVPALCALLAAGALLMLGDVAYLDIDAAQYLSVARNLLDGNGLSTSLVYYEQHLTQARMPAPQTVFPPGMPLAVAPLLAAGVDAPDAALVSGLLAFCAIGLALALLLRMLGVGAALASLGALIWFAQGTAWANVLLGRTENLYTLFTVLAAIALVAADGVRRRYFLAGLCAAAALLVRYQGLFFVAALGIWCAWTWWRTPRAERGGFVAGAIALLTPPFLAVAWLLIRNMTLVGAPGGGPVDTANWLPASGLEIVRSAYWAMIPALGLSFERLAGLRWQEVALVIGVAALLVWVLRNRSSVGEAIDGVRACSAQTAVMRLCLAYLAVTLLSLALLATRSTGYMEGRFFAPLVPFVAAAWLVLLRRVGERMSMRSSPVLVAALVAVHLALFSGQWNVLRDRLDALRADLRIAELRAALAQDVGGVSLARFLAENVSLRSPLLATAGQQLWLLQPLPVIEPTPAGFTRRVFDEAEISRLSRCYGTRLLMFMPRLYTPRRPENANQPLFSALAAGERPAGLEPLLLSERVELYRIESPVTSGGRQPQDQVDDDCN